MVDRCGEQIGGQRHAKMTQNEAEDAWGDPPISWIVVAPRKSVLEGELRGWTVNGVQMLEPHLESKSPQTCGDG